MNVLKPTYCIDGPPLIGSDMVAVKKIMYASDLEVVGVVYARDIHFYDVRNGRLVARMPAASEGQAGEGHAAEIADVAWDIDTTLITNSNGSCEYERVFIVVSGDRFGKIAVWNGKTIARHVERQRQDPHLQALCFRPARTIQAHRDSITCVDVDAFKVTSVGADGYVRVWDIMLGRLLRTMNVRYFRHLARNRNEPIEPPVAVNEGGADPQLHANDRYIVRYIYTTLHQIVVAVNGQVKTWDLDPERVLARWSESGRKIKNKAKRRVSGANAAPKAERRFRQGSVLYLCATPFTIAQCATSFTIAHPIIGNHAHSQSGAT